MFSRELRTNGILRAVGVSVAYLVVWTGLNLLATGFPTAKTVNPWYLSAAVTFYLLYTCGTKYAPLPLLAELIRQFIPLGVHSTSWPSVTFGVVAAVGYALTARVSRDVLRINLPFIGLRDAARFGGVAAVAPLIVGAVMIALLALQGVVPWPLYFNRVLTFWVGDSVGLFVLVPVLATYLTPLIAPWTVSPEARDDRVPITFVECISLYIILIGSVVIGYSTVPTGTTSHPLLYFTFLPLLWLATRGGLRIAITGIAIADVVTTILNAWFPTPASDPLQLQSFIVVSALTALVVGAQVNDYHRGQRQAQLLALRDPLTGLANRTSMESWMAIAPLSYSLVVLDIDRMKLANDGLSRSASEELLRLVAQRLQFLEAPFVAHVGPDEFACAFTADRPAAELASHVSAIFDEPFAVDESEVYVSTTLGIATATTYAERALALRHAEVAMYRAKRAGRGGYLEYTAKLEAAESNVSLASELHRAFRESEFTLYYQPLYRVDEDGRRCIGAEALLRWRHPQLGVLEPGAFLDLLESLALADRVGEWVVYEACRQVREWTDRGLDLSMWVNVFPRQALDPNFTTAVTRALVENRVKPELLVLEIVERVFGEDEKQVGESIHSLRSLGVQIAIDDFGTGHSSLARLRESPAHIMKIDGSFVKRSEVDPRARGVVHAVLQIAQEMRLTPLAEGIENEAQLKLVTDQGCRLVQGYHLARPMPPEQVERLLLGTAAR